MSSMHNLIAKGHPVRMVAKPAAAAAAINFTNQLKTLNEKNLSHRRRHVFYIAACFFSGFYKRYFNLQAKKIKA
jgi:hypothetical protein